MARNGLKMGSFHLFVHPKRPWINLGKRCFHPFLTHFWSPKGLFSRHLGTFGGLKQATMGSKRAKTTCFGIPQVLGSLFEKNRFSPGGHR